MGFLEKLYGKSPILFQNIMTSVAGYKNNRSRYGKVYHDYLDFLSEFDTWDLGRKLEYQLTELQKFLKYTTENSKFYKELYKEIDIESIQTISDLKKLPVVDKETLRQNINDIITIPHKKAVEGHTGGTTGKSLVVLYTPEDMMKRMAMLDHFKKRVGFEHRKMKRATFNGKHIVPQNQKKKIFWRYNASCKQMIYSSFHISEENLKYYVESLNRYKPQAIDGFFMSIYDIANFIERHNIMLEFTPLAIFPTSETITQPGRELVERVFKCKVFDQYASSEGAPFVTECKEQVLHMELSTGVIEQFKDNSDEILVTSFTTHGTPLVRYRIGDSMIFEKSSSFCNCGNNTSVIKEIKGRRLDFLYSSNGTKISGVNIANGFKNIPNAIINAQVVQERVGEIIIKLVVDKKQYKKEYDVLLVNEFVHKFGSKTHVLIEHIEEIPREKSGKLRLIINKVNI